MSDPLSCDPGPCDPVPCDPVPCDVVVPALIRGDDDRAHLAECVAALLTSVPPPASITVVDDGSPSPIPSPDPRVTVLRQDNAGPAAARNAGARLGSSPFVAFVDADVFVPPDALSRLVADLDAAPDAAAAWATVRAACPQPDRVSRYKNLSHRHFTLTMAPPGMVAATPHLTSMLVALRRDAFDAVGGFDAAMTTVSVEDVALGRALVAAGHRVLLDAGVAVAHAHRFTLRSAMRNDAHKLRRLVALGPARRAAADPAASSDAARAVAARQTAYALGAPLGLLALAGAAAGALPLSLAALAALSVAERDLMRFLADAEGWPFALSCLPLMAVERTVALAAGATGLADRVRR